MASFKETLKMVSLLLQDKQNSVRIDPEVELCYVEEIYIVIPQNLFQQHMYTPLIHALVLGLIRAIVSNKHM